MQLQRVSRSTFVPALVSHRDVSSPKRLKVLKVRFREAASEKKDVIFNTISSRSRTRPACMETSKPQAQKMF